MATHKSAVKRHKQSLVKKARNKAVRGRIRATVSKAIKQSEEGQVSESKVTAKLATKLIDKAASKGSLHKNNVKRRLSRLAKKVAKSEKSTK